MGGGNSTLSKKYVAQHKHAKEGDTVPDVMLKFRIIDKNSSCGEDRGQPALVWKDVPSLDLFRGKRVVIFGVPGGTTHNLLQFT